MSRISWEAAVRWYRAQPGNEQAICDNYFDLPVLSAAERYAGSEEFAEVLRLLGAGDGRSVLDLGAGNGIASLALARNGWNVTALEPDPSTEVGAGAIRQIAHETGLPIRVVEEWGERLPFPDASFDAAHCRQVFHHAHDLERMAAEVFRVLKPGGHALITREHVVDDAEQLAAFLKNHPLQHLYGGEHAYAVSRYVQAVSVAGFRVSAIWGPLESILNFFPGTEAQRRAAVVRRARRHWLGLGFLLSASRVFQARALAAFTRRDRTPGRLFSFLVARPSGESSEKPCVS
ncbi:MAG: methyltransferase domain-containing protein [Nitrospirota bacterium]|nr:methyltransferase domain-containing protein [Nitrospirota bacterium]